MTFTRRAIGAVLGQTAIAGKIITAGKGPGPRYIPTPPTDFSAGATTQLNQLVDPVPKAIRDTVRQMHLGARTGMRKNDRIMQAWAYAQSHQAMGINKSWSLAFRHHLALREMNEIDQHHRTMYEQLRDMLMPFDKYQAEEYDRRVNEEDYGHHY